MAAFPSFGQAPFGGGWESAPSYQYTGVGGAQSGGSAAVAFGAAAVGAGGAQSGGAALVQFGAAFVGSGGAQSGGTAAVDFNHAHVYDGAGGAQSGGAALVQFGAAVVAAGGAESGGAALVQFGAVFLGSGGAQSGGTALVSFPEERLLTVRLRDAAGAPQVGAVVLARRVRVGGSKRSVVVPDLSRAVTDGDGVAVLTLMPSFGDAYRVTATAADGTPLLDVAVLVGSVDGELHSLPRVEDLQAWH